VANLNKLLIIGNMTADPELRFTPNGSAVASVDIAVNYKYKETKETSFFSVVVWGKAAENLAEYKKKGDPILVEGRLRQRTWKTPEGQNRSKIEIVAENVQYLNRAQNQPGQQSRNDDSYVGDIDIDDVPF
jgi:single-strand DNA-binding protein